MIALVLPRVPGMSLRPGFLDWAVAVKLFCFDTSQQRVSRLRMRWFVRREMARVEGRFAGAVRSGGSPKCSPGNLTAMFIS
jgi:hypothetical protein